MTFQEMIDLAATEGFSAAQVVDTRKIVFDPSFRPYCEENLCGQYGVNYACPPDCGSPDEMKQRILAHHHCLLLQTMHQVEDYSDKAAAKAAKRSHNAASLRLMQQLREKGVPGFMVGSGGCALCQPCRKKENLPCTFPELQYSCMSAYCIFVKKLADEAGVEYDCGPGLLALFGLYVFD